MDLLVKDVADEAASHETNNSRKRDRFGRSRERDTSNENDGLDALTEDSDEWEDKHGILFSKLLEASTGASLDGRL